MNWKKIKKNIKLFWKYRSFDFKHLDNQARRKRLKARKKKIIDNAGKCAHCGTKNNLTIDHIIPLSRGGSRNGLHNLQVLCFRCNKKKADKLPLFTA